MSRAMSIAKDQNVQETWRRSRHSLLFGRGSDARMAEGWQFMAITSELKMMLNGAAIELKKITGGLAPTGEMARY